MYTYTRRSSISPLFLVAPAILLIALAAVQTVRGVPALVATTTLPVTSVLGPAQQPPLPSGGSSAVSVVGLGTLRSAGQQTPRPIASVTKIMTARVILKDHPLKPGETGPTVTTTAADAARYVQMLAQDQSTLPVTSGMVFSELELLQGMLIPSANNFAEILANWDAGSVPAFVQEMNAEARVLGMTNTTYTDTSGFSAGSVSTALDQLILARAAMEDPVFAQIVSTPQVRLPGIGLVSNVNELLGKDGVVGIKTGFTEEAGGNLVFAAKRQVNGREVQIIGAVLGQSDRAAAFEATRQVIAPLAQGLQVATLVGAGQPVATIDPPWDGTVDVVSAEDVQFLFWPGMTLETSVEVGTLEGGMRANTQVGWLTVRVGEQERRVPLKLGKDLPKAGIVWKLTRT